MILAVENAKVDVSSIVEKPPSDAIHGFDGAKQKAYFLRDGVPCYSNAFKKEATDLLVTALWNDSAGNMIHEWEIDSLTDVPGHHGTKLCCTLQSINIKSMSPHAMQMTTTIAMWRVRIG
jgi:hypothetical protein